MPFNFSVNKRVGFHMRLDFKYFDPRIVLDFEPESPEMGAEYPVSEFMFGAQQQIDLSEALLYAENEIIPEFLRHKSNNYADLTPDRIVFWIRNLHKFVGKTLSSQNALLVPGEYPPKTILRWEKTLDMRDELAEEIARNANVTPVFKKYGLKEIAKPFMNILNRVYEDRTIEEVEEKRFYYKNLNERIAKKIEQFNPKEKVMLERSRTFDKKLHKLIDAKHQGKLSESDLKIINQVIKICLPPEKIPQALHNFAVQLIEKLKTNQGSLESLAQLMTFSYAEQTEIHPFFNGNGRDALIFMNILAIVHKFSSILLRKRTDKYNPKSRYSIAINHININRNILQSHIQSCILEALKEKKLPTSLADWQYHEVVKKNIAFCEQLLKLKALGKTDADLQGIFEARKVSLQMAPSAKEYTPAFKTSHSKTEPESSTADFDQAKMETKLSGISLS